MVLSGWTECRFSSLTLFLSSLKDFDATYTCPLSLANEFLLRFEFGGFFRINEPINWFCTHGLSTFRTDSSSSDLFLATPSSGRFPMAHLRNALSVGSVLDRSGLYFMELPDSLRADNGDIGTWLDWDYLAPKRCSSATGCRRSALVVVYKAFSKAGFQVQHTLAIRRESKVSLKESSQGQHVLEPDQWLYNLDSLRVPDSLVPDIWTSAFNGVGALTGLSCTDAL